MQLLQHRQVALLLPRLEQRLQLVQRLQLLQRPGLRPRLLLMVRYKFEYFVKKKREQWLLYFIFKANLTYSCGEGTSVNRTCTGSATLNIVQATYTESSCTFCNCSCAGCSVTSTIVNLCANRTSCAFTAANTLFGDPCVGRPKSFALVYYCGWIMHTSFGIKADFSKIRFVFTWRQPAKYVLPLFPLFSRYNMTVIITHWSKHIPNSLFSIISLSCFSE
jgi:hypothetical protein